MLKISVEGDSQGITLKIEGKLVGPWVAEFERLWEQVTPWLGRRNVALDIRHMTFIDGHGIETLRNSRRWSASELVADSPLTRHFSDQIRGLERNDEAKEVALCDPRTNQVS